MKKLFCLFLGLLLLTGCVFEGKISPSETPAAAVSAGVEGWGFRRIPGGRPEFTAAQIAAMDTYGCLYMGKEAVQVVVMHGAQNVIDAYVICCLKIV